MAKNPAYAPQKVVTVLKIISRVVFCLTYFLFCLLHLISGGAWEYCGTPHRVVSRQWHVYVLIKLLRQEHKVRFV